MNPPPKLRKPEDALWAPNSLPQRGFMSSPADEACYGGAAGGGKSDALLIGALRYVHRPRYQGIIFRRHYKDLEKTVIPRARELFPSTGGREHRGNYTWSWPTGARVYLANLEDDAAALSHKSAQYQYIGFDELTSFTRFQYTYLFSRGRSPDPEVPVRFRAGTNPGDIGHQWVFERWAPWLDPTHAHRARPGEVRWFLPGAGPDNERGEPTDVYVPRGTPGAMSRVFFPALAKDNPDLARSDPHYTTRLNNLDRVSRLQLRDGDWLIKPGGGEYFDRAWWRYLDEAPPRSAWRAAIRAWDLAATVDGDWTVGVLLAHVPTAVTPWVVVDVVRFRGTPGAVRKRVKETAEADGADVVVCLPQDPGQAGVDQADSYVADLAGYDVRTRRPTGDKVKRASTWSPQVEHHQVALVRAAWNGEYVTEHQDFPDGRFDDQVDASADAFNELAGVPGPSDIAGWMAQLAAAGVGTPREAASPARWNRPPSEREDDFDEDDDAPRGRR